MFATYHNDEKRLERRARTTYDLFKAIQETNCSIETIEGQGRTSKQNQLIGHRDGTIENMKHVKLQPGNFRVPEGSATVKLFISTRGMPFRVFDAIRESEFYISDVYTDRQHVETEIVEGSDGDDEVKLLDVTTQLILKFDEEI
jgi:hypothetical protein